MKKAEIGMIGLAVMGENLAMNMESRGFTVAVWNRSAEKTDAFLNGRAAGRKFIGCRSLHELAASLARPRKILMMVRAGAAVDQLIERLLPLLEEGDILIDGGNSHYTDTVRRTAAVESRGLRYVGCGVSGGEEGALKGPSLMPGGSRDAWEEIRPVFQAICARAEDGAPCCEWVGENGAGHFVKMVHNGIEYGDMQLICEAYQLMRDGLGMTGEEMSAVFANWNRTELDSYLIGITAEILRHRENGELTVEKILDRAGQKGTGKWTGITALDEGVPLTLISEAVFARCLSAQKDERVRAAALYGRKISALRGEDTAILENLRRALYVSRLVSYAQGFALMRAAAESNGWRLNYSGIARIWRGGCIIRSRFLGKISEAFDRDPSLENLLLDPGFCDAVKERIPAWRETVALAVKAGIPMPAFSSALSWFDGYTCSSLPANLLQAQRDYFGAHTYERVDAPRGEFFHTDWTGHGGQTASSGYNA